MYLVTITNNGSNYREPDTFTVKHVSYLLEPGNINQLMLEEERALHNTGSRWQEEKILKEGLLLGHRWHEPQSQRPFNYIVFQ